VIVQAIGVTMAIPPFKKRKSFNGYKDGAKVKILSPTSMRQEIFEMRRVGEAGFYVKGLATCFYWHEKSNTWDDVEKVEEST